MCDLVEEYAKEYADQQKIELMVEGYINNAVVLSFALKILNLTEEQFMEYVQKYKDKNGE